MSSVEFFFLVREKLLDSRRAETDVNERTSRKKRRENLYKKIELTDTRKTTLGDKGRLG